ncbi:MAG: response regulator, partial [Gammaproteobacteria bacterium]|nr:response regulator [Gammaproteobacteria bacterium]
LGVGRNITERKEAEMALLESEQQVRDLLYSTAEAIYGLDLQGNCTFANPACAQMLGYQDVDELIGCNMHDKIHYKRSDGSAYPVEECPIFHAFHTGDGTHINNDVLWRADGSSFPAEYWSYPINRDGAVVGAVVTFLDITKRRQADSEKEQLLHDKGERIKELQCLYGITEATNKHNDLEDILYDAVRIIPPGWHYPEYTKARIIFDNKEFVEGPFESTRWKQACDLVVRNEYRGSIEVYYTKEFPELDEGPFLHEERSLINGISKVLSERIERKQAEAERERLQRELQQAQKMDALGQLTGGIAHDFNNLLGIIMGYSELAKDRSIGKGDAKLAKQIERVLRASERAKELVARMLAFSRDEASEKTPLQLQPFLMDDIKMLRSILPASIEIQTEIEDDLPYVLMDEMHLNQLLINLSINARDAMGGEGNLTIRLGLTEDIDAECATCHRQVTGDWVELSVADTGGGIRVDILERIFEPFFTTKDVGKGTGLGLSVVHGIMRSHGGHVLVDTELEKGSTIRLLFPPAVEEMSKIIEEVPLSEMPPQGHGEHILVLDDEPELAEYTGELLESYGYKVTIKTDSIEALSLFREDPGEFALLITDQTMPGLTGVELTKQLREIRPNFPVTLCTGYSESINADAAKNIGIRYLNKPIDAEKLIRSIAELLG